MLSSERKAQPIVIRQQQTSRKRETKITRDYQTNISNVAHTAREKVQGKVRVEKIPELKDGENHIGKIERPIGTLKKFLKWARIKSECSKISQTDLRYIVYCCNYTGGVPLTDRLEESFVRLLRY